MMDDIFCESTEIHVAFGEHNSKPDAPVCDESDKEKDLADVEVFVKEEKKKRKSQRVLLNAEKLCGVNGIARIPDIFAGVKFRGKGHEFDDLSMVMAKLENWAHRLCPKMPFDEALEKMEDLGSKRAVKTTLVKLRLGNIDEKEGDVDPVDTNMETDKHENSKNKTTEMTNKTTVEAAWDDDAFDEILANLPADSDIILPRQSSCSQPAEFREEDDNDRAAEWEDAMDW